MNAARNPPGVPAVNGLVVAIDGPVASGKTSVGRAAARRLGLRFLDTGIMYRAVTWLALERNIAVANAAAVGALAQSCRLTLAHAAIDRIAPDGIAIDRIAPDRIAIDRIAPDRIAPDRIAPDRIAPDRIAPDRIAPDRIAPDRIAPDRIAPDRIPVDGIATHSVAADGIVADDIAGQASAAAGIAVDGRPLADAELRSPAVARNVSAVSAISAVRRALVRQQREIAAAGGIIMAGRDIGSVVLPNADVKLYIDADPATRARRRLLQTREQAAYPNPYTAPDAIPDYDDDYARTLADTVRRDRLDSGRADSPLAIAPGAIVINTGHIGLEQTVAAVVSAIMTATRRR